MSNVNTPIVLAMEPAAVRDAVASMERFADKYRKEPDLRARMEEDPAAVFADFGLDLPPHTDVRVVEDSADVFHVTLPLDPNVQLGDEQLNTVAGGGKTAGYSPGGLTAEQADLGTPASRGGTLHPRECFLTTAVVERRGEADDGPTLQALRGFRDGYMMETAERRALVADYYRTAPAVVAAIPADHADWSWIGERIDDAAAAIGNGDDDGAFAVYVDLMERLTSRWLGSAADGR